MLRKGLPLLLLFASHSFAEFSISTEQLPAGSQLALTVIDSKSGKTASKINQNMLLPPASTQKIVTSLAASLYLPKNFSFRTNLYRANHDLVIQFGGDPSLTRQELKKLLAKLKQEKIQKIDGDIWLDASIFTGYDKGIGWPWDILGVCYSAPSSAIALEENCFHATLYANKDKSTRIFVPQHQPIYITTQALALTKEEQKQTHCELDLAFDQNNHYQLSGCTSEIKTALPLQFAIQNPAKYTADVITQLLQELNIDFNGKIRYQEKVPQAIQAQKIPVASHFSKQRDALLNDILKDSNNLISDNLLKIIGHKYYNQAGSFRNGVDAVKEIIEQKTGIALSEMQMVDGSGLSRNNRISTAKLGEILLWIYNNPQLGLIEMLPIAGVDGTLKYRHGVRYSPIKNNLLAKSGSLYGSHNLAGVLRRAEGDLLVIQFVSNYFVSEAQQKLDKENKNNMPIVKFEKSLYQQLLTTKDSLQ